jgi:hypothetical protein
MNALRKSPSCITISSMSRSKYPPITFELCQEKCIEWAYGPLFTALDNPTTENILNVGWGYIAWRLMTKEDWEKVDANGLLDTIYQYEMFKELYYGKKSLVDKMIASVYK